MDEERGENLVGVLQEIGLIARRSTCVLLNKIARGSHTGAERFKRYKYVTVSSSSKGLLFCQLAESFLAEARAVIGVAPNAGLLRGQLRDWRSMSLKGGVVVGASGFLRTLTSEVV